MIHHPSHPPLRWGNFFLSVIPRPAGFFINDFTFPVFLSADGNVAGWGYHFGSADNDNPLAFLSSQKCGGPAGGLSNRAYIVPAAVSVPVALSLFPAPKQSAPYRCISTGMKYGRYAQGAGMV